MKDANKRALSYEEKRKSVQTCPIVWTHVWFGYLCVLPTDANKAKVLPKGTSNPSGQIIK